MAMRDAFEGCKGSGVAGGTSPDVREGRWRADYPMIQINAVAQTEALGINLATVQK